MYEEPTKLEMFLAEIQKTGTSEGLGSIHSVTVRMPTIEFATIEALCRASGMPRNKVIVNLLQVALDEMWKGVDPEMRDVITGLQGVVLRDLVQDDQGNIKAHDQAKKGEL